MKKLYRFILTSYIGSFIVTFFIAVFIFLMVFVFTYIDEFIGKNIHPSILTELFFYFSLNTISRALPLAILLSCIMTMGNLTEHYEIAAMKSAGISFFKIVKPLFVFAICMNVFLLSFSNIILPSTNLQLETLLISVRSSKPALFFKEGVFNNALRGYSIRIGKISNEGKLFHDILIYDHSESKGNTIVMTAKTGSPQEFGSHGILFFVLNNGTSYKEEATDSTGTLNNSTFIRTNFEQRIIRFNLSSFMFTKANSANFKDDYAVLTMNQLTAFIDSLKILNKKLSIQLKGVSTPVSLTEKDKTKRASLQKELINKIEINDSRVIKYSIEWHKRLASSFACILFFLIGVPLGYIVKKGGLGMPVVISAILFIFFHVVSIIGEKLAEDGLFEPYQGIWLSLFLFLPAGIVLFYKASTDRLSFENGITLFRKK